MVASNQVRKQMRAVESTFYFFKVNAYSLTGWVVISACAKKNYFV